MYLSKNICICCRKIILKMDFPSLPPGRKSLVADQLLVHLLKENVVGDLAHVEASLVHDGDDAGVRLIYSIYQIQNH